MDEKVFCLKCKWYHNYDSGKDCHALIGRKYGEKLRLGGDHRESEYLYNWIPQFGIHSRSAEEVNKNNNCAEFKPKTIFSRIKWFFKGNCYHFDWY